ATERRPRCVAGPRIAREPRKSPRRARSRVIPSRAVGARHPLAAAAPRPRAQRLLAIARALGHSPCPAAPARSRRAGILSPLPAAPSHQGLAPSGQAEEDPMFKRPCFGLWLSLAAGCGAGNLSGCAASELAGSLPIAEQATIEIPIDAAQSITLRRVNVTSTEKGTAWDGIVQETGESAMLMLWSNGRIGGALGY